MLLSALANQCHSFAMLVATSLLPCHSYAILCQAIAFHRIAFQRFAFPLHNTANLRHAMPLPLVACQNFASPLPIKTVLCIPSPSSSPHNFAIAFPLFARPIHAFSMLCSCKSLLIDARPLLCCSNQHLRITQSFTGSLCHSLCYPELSHCHSAPFIANPLHCESKLCRRCFRHGYHLHHSCVHAPTCAGL